jgi:hypothetical protein
MELLARYNLTPDVIVIVMIFLLAIYGVVLGQNKIKTLALSVYVGIVVATELGGVASDFLVKQPAASSITPGLINLVLFGLPILILEFGRKQHSRGKSHGGMVMTLVLSVLTSALIVSSGMHLISGGTLRSLLDSSIIASSIYRFRLVWIAAVPLAVLGESFIRNRERD